MPYAKRRDHYELNRAYAHVANTSWPNAIKQLHDNLVHMGFEVGVGIMVAHHPLHRSFLLPTNVMHALLDSSLP